MRYIISSKVPYIDDEILDYTKFKGNYPRQDLVNDEKYMKSDIAKGYITNYTRYPVEKIYIEDKLYKASLNSNISINKNDIGKDKYFNIDFTDTDGQDFYAEVYFWKYKDNTKTKAYYFVSQRKRYYKNFTTDTFIEVDVSDGPSIKSPIIMRPSSQAQSHSSSYQENNIDLNVHRSYNIRGILDSDALNAIYERHNGFWVSNSPSTNSYESTIEGPGIAQSAKGTPAFLQVISHVDEKTKNGLVIHKYYESRGIREYKGVVKNGMVTWVNSYRSWLEGSMLSDIIGIEKSLGKVEGENEYAEGNNMRNEYIPKYKYKFKNKDGKTMERTGIHTLDEDFIYKLASVLDDKSNLKKVQELIKTLPIYDDYVYDKENQKLADHIKKNSYPENYIFRYLGQVEYTHPDGTKMNSEEVNSLFDSVSDNSTDRDRLWKWMNNKLGREFIITSRENPLINGYFVKKPGVRIDIPGSKKERLGILKVYTYPQREYVYNTERFRELESTRYMINKGKGNPNIYLPAIPEGKKSIYPVNGKTYLNGERISRMYIYQELPVNKDYLIRGSDKFKSTLKTFTEKQLNDELEDTIHYSQFINNIFAIDDEYPDLTKFPVNKKILEGEEQLREVDKIINDFNNYRYVVPYTEDWFNEKYSLYPIEKMAYFNRNDIISRDNYYHSPRKKEEYEPNVALNIPKPPIIFTIKKVHNYGWLDHRLSVASDRIDIRSDIGNRNETKNNPNKNSILENTFIVRPFYKNLKK